MIDNSYSEASYAGESAAPEDERTDVHRGAPPIPRALLAVASEERRETVARGLWDMGCRVFAVDNVNDLVSELVDAVLCTPQQESCVVIADMTLPGVSGLSLLAAIRDMRWQVPVILLSREGERRKRRRASRLGATAVFIEPVCLRELLALAKLVLDPSTFGAIHNARLRSAETSEFYGEASEW